jgi:hypothetical protein
MMFGLDDQLPKFEASARELVHPLFDKLKAEVGHAVLCCAVLCWTVTIHKSRLFFGSSTRCGTLIGAQLNVAVSEL